MNEVGVWAMEITLSLFGILSIFLSTLFVRLIAEFSIRLSRLPVAFRWIFGFIVTLLVCTSLSFAVMVYFPEMAFAKQPLVLNPFFLSVVFGIFYSPVIEIVSLLLIWSMHKSVFKRR